MNALTFFLFPRLASYLHHIKKKRPENLGSSISGNPTVDTLQKIAAALIIGRTTVKEERIE